MVLHIAFVDLHFGGESENEAQEISLNPNSL